MSDIKVVKVKYENVGNVYGALRRECPICNDITLISKQAIPHENYCRNCGVRFYTEGIEE